MAPVSAADGGDLRRMAGGLQPVVNRGADLASLNGRLTRAMMSGDQEHDAVAAVNRPLEDVVDRLPGTVESHSVKIERTVRLDLSGPEPAVPTRVECRPGVWSSRRRLKWKSGRATLNDRRGGGLRLLVRPLRLRSLLARQRRDGGRYARPEFCLFRAERTHAPPCPSAAI